MKYYLKLLSVALLGLVLAACSTDDLYSETEEDTYDTGSSSGGTSDSSSLILGKWKLTDPDPAPVITTITFDQYGRGENYIDGAGVYQSETRGYDYKIEGDNLYFRYDEVGEWGVPSEIRSISSTELKLYHSDNTTGTYVKVSSSDSGNTDSGTGTDDDTTDTGTCDSPTGTGISVYLIEQSTSSTTITGSVDVYIDEGYVGSLSSYFTGEPCYGQSGTLNVDLSYGSHTISASGTDSNGSTITWSSDSFELSSTSETLLYGLSF